MDFDYVITDLGNKALVPNVIQKAYETLNLISFFTTGEKESRAWTCPKWSKAPQAAGVIHSDFEKNLSEPRQFHIKNSLKPAVGVKPEIKAGLE